MVKWGNYNIYSIILISKACMPVSNSFFKKTEFKIFIIAFLVFEVFTHTYVAAGNVSSSFATIQSMVEDNTFVIYNIIFMGGSNCHPINDGTYYL